MKKVYLLYAFSRDLDADDFFLGVYENYDDVVKAKQEFKEFRHYHCLYNYANFVELDFHPSKIAQ